MAFGLYKAQKKDWFVFLLGLFTIIKLRLIGTFGVCELILIPMLIMLRHNACFHDKRARLYMFYIGLWILGTILTDVYRHSPSESALKGAMSVVFLLLIFPATYWCLYDKPQRILYYFGGVAFSYIIGFIIQSEDLINEIDEDVWQVYAYHYAAVFIASIFLYKGKTWLGIAILLGYGFWALFHFSRNIFLTCGLGSLVILLVHYYYKTTQNVIAAQYKFNHNAIVLCLALLVGFGGIKYVYEDLASSGALGERALYKYNQQKNSELGLASGRGDFFVSLALIKESPIVGYGSYAHDKEEKAYRLKKAYGMNGNFKYMPNDIRNMQLPGHSYIIGAWIYNGILGLPIWIYTIYLIFIYYKKGLYLLPKVTPLIIAWSFIMLFNIFFSPFTNRPIITFFVAEIITTLNISINNQSNKLITNG